MKEHFQPTTYFVLVLMVIPLPPTLSGPLSITSQGIGEKMVPSVLPGTPILQLK